MTLDALGTWTVDGVGVCGGDCGGGCGDCGSCGGDCCGSG